jgi:1,3-beta-glucanosyltransferase GAS5
MAPHPNTLGVLVANEVINDHNSTAAAPVIRAVTRDVKSYMALAWEASEQRVLPVGYNAANVGMVTRSTFDYLTAGSRDESIDFYCVSPWHYNKHATVECRCRLSH